MCVHTQTVTRAVAMAEGDEDGLLAAPLRRFDEGFAGDVELQIDGVPVIYHRDRSVAWAMGDVEQAAHAENPRRKAIKRLAWTRARCVGTATALRRTSLRRATWRRTTL